MGDRRRQWVAPVVTGVLLVGAWTVPVWSDRPTDTGITVTAQPQLRQPGTSPEPAQDAGFSIDVEVAGAGAGHPVTLESWSDGMWVPADEGATDGAGRVQLDAAAGVHARVVTDVDGSRTVRTFDAPAVGPALVYSEEFSAGVLPPEWLAIPQPDDGETCSMTGDEGTSTADGQLTLTVVEDESRTCADGTSPMLINGHLVLRVGLGHGTTAARIRLPRGRSVSSQFWLQPGDPVQRWVMDDEHEGVVVVETRGTASDPRLGTSVNRTVDERVVASARLAPRGVAPADGRYHVYAVEWTPEDFTFSVDGKVVRRVRAASPVPPVVIGLSVRPGGDPLPQDAERRSMDVDWIRVWAP